jgi:hypothetical protein
LRFVQHLFDRRERSSHQRYPLARSGYSSASFPATEPCGRSGHRADALRPQCRQVVCAAQVSGRRRQRCVPNQATSAPKSMATAGTVVRPRVLVQCDFGDELV